MKHYWTYTLYTGYDSEKAVMANCVAETCQEAVKMDLSSKGSNLRRHFTLEALSKESPMSLEETLGRLIALNVCSGNSKLWVRDDVRTAQLPTLPLDLGRSVHVENGVRLWLRGSNYSAALMTSDDDERVARSQNRKTLEI